MSQPSPHDVHARPVRCGNACEELADLLRGKEFAARLASVARAHGHEELGCVAVSAGLVVLETATEVELGNLVGKLDELLGTLLKGRAELVTADVDIVKQTLEGALTVGTRCQRLGVLEDAREDLVAVLATFFKLHAVLVDGYQHAGEQLAREDEEALLLDSVLAPSSCFPVRKRRVVEVWVVLLFGEVIAKVLSDGAVEQHAEHVLFEVPSIDAASQVFGNGPDVLVQLCALRLFRYLRQLEFA